MAILHTLAGGLFVLNSILAGSLDVRRPGDPASENRPAQIGQPSEQADDNESTLPMTRLPITMVARQSPVCAETISVALWDDRRVTFNVTTAGKASAPVEVCRDVGDLLGRRFDAAFESKSGEGLVACLEPGAGVIHCISISGAVVRRERELRVPGGLKIAYLGMKAQGLSDEITLMASGISSENKLQLLSNVWDGKSWRGWEVISEDLERDEQGAGRGE